MKVGLNLILSASLLTQNIAALASVIDSNKPNEPGRDVASVSVLQESSVINEFNEQTELVNSGNSLLSRLDRATLFDVFAVSQPFKPSSAISSLAKTNSFNL